MADTNIATLITELTEARDTIRSKFVELGISTSTDKLSDLAEDATNIANHGAVQATVLEGKTYTIPKGYHNGAGTVTGLTDTAGEAEKYKLQAKTITPTKAQQEATPDSGYYGLSSVKVNAIPAAYQDVTSVTATAPDVRVGKTFVAKDGTVIAGTMGNVSNQTTVTPDNYETETNDYKLYSKPIGTGYIQSGYAQVQATECAPTFKAAGETIEASDYFFDSVKIPAVPDTGITTDQVLKDKTYYNGGALKTGTMPNNEAYTATMTQDDTGLSSDRYLKKIPKGYHDGNGYIEVNAGSVSVTPTEAAQTINPTTGYGFITQVNVAAINKSGKLQEWTADATATTLSEGKSPDILLGKTAYVDGAKLTGSMPNNGKVTATLTGLTTDSMSYTIPAGYHNGTGTVSLTSDIEELLAAI